VADRILNGPSPNETAGALSVSVGIAQLDPADPNPARLIRDADAALYDAKIGGRHAVAIAGAGRPVPIAAAAAQARPGVRDANRDLMAEAVRAARRVSEESRTILDTLVLVAPVGFSFIDREFRIVLTNPAMAAAHGGAVQDQVGHTVAELVPDLWPGLEPIYRRVVADGKPIHGVEVRGPSADDPAVEHAWLCSYYPVCVDGEVIGLGVVALDITDRLRLERSQADLTSAVVSAMANTAEARDPYTAGHQKRVAGIAAAIATELGVEEHTVQGIELAAAIHDIGKVAIPAEILARPGRISDEELALVRTHTTAGYNILRDIEFPWPIAQIVLQHHERIDGSGYPRQLVGEQIHIGARIIAVADTLEAMAAHRPYRAALGLDVALTAIAEGRDRVFDPAVVDACLRLFRNGPLTLDLARYLGGEQDHLRPPARTISGDPTPGEGRPAALHLHAAGSWRCERCPSP
jgi:putative nucleotidyltransferase with HDIG domain